MEAAFPTAGALSAGEFQREKAAWWFHWVPLRHAADGRSLGLLALHLALLFTQWTGSCRHWSLLLVSCGLAFVACVIKHNHIHCRTFARRGWNRALEFLLALGTGQSTAAIIPVHNERHHAHPHSDADCVRSSLVNFRWNWVNLLVFPFVVVRLVRRCRPHDQQRWRRERPELLRRLRRERLMFWTVAALLLAADWRATLIYCGVPWIFGQWGIVTINLLQHQDCDPASAYDHSRNVTGRVGNWLFLNNGFHTAHHLRPALHWSRLPEFHHTHVKPRMRPELDEASLVLAVWRQFFSPAGRVRAK